MPWALTNCLERRAKDIPASPKVLVFGTMFSAFAAVPNSCMNWRRGTEHIWHSSSAVS